MEVEEECSSNGEVLPLPDSFVEFLSKNGLDPSIYTHTNSIPRYIRVKPGFENQIEEIEAEIKCKLQSLSWLPNFYFLPPDIRIVNSKAYKEGKIYGIDAASGAAVTALRISPGDHVLDLCAAPGAKLCFISDLLGHSGSVTGIDIAKHRLAACRTMLQKYALGERCRLFVADGTTFSLLPVRVKQGECIHQEDSELYKEWTSRRPPWKERRRALKERENGKLVSKTDDPELIYYGSQSGVVGLSKGVIYRNMTDTEISVRGYDKVLVDAECTHDGSIRHIQKFESQWGWETLQRRVLDVERTDELTMLQLQLLTNGFRLLKSSGSLVYSTCSLTVAQNEDVVKKFLSQNTNAELVDIESSKNWPGKSGQIPKTLRFDPSTSCTSGLFIAKFTKLAS